MGKMKSEVKARPKVVRARVMVAPPTQKRKKNPTRSSGSSTSGLMGQLGLGIGNLLGGPAGGLTGLAAGKLISRITGFGDYKVQRNSISNGNSIPTFSNGGKGMRCMHREFLSDVVGSVGFTNTTYNINPGLVRTFPWLSLIAADFEEYDLEGLVFEYRPTSGTAVSATSSALGVVILATDYDAIDPAFTTKQQMESYEYANSTVPFSGCIHPVECLKKLNVLGSQYVRTGAVPTDADIRLYDLGLFQIATAGMQSVYTVGELWVSYDAVFRKPRLPPTISPISYTRLWNSTASNCNSTASFGATAMTVKAESTLLGVSAIGNTLILANVGTYHVAINWHSGSGTVTNITGQTFSANITNATEGWAYNSPATFIANTCTGSNDIVTSFFARVTAPGLTNTVTMPLIAVGGVNCTVVVTLINSVLTQDKVRRAPVRSRNLSLGFSALDLEEGQDERKVDWL
jgi:hypothetical protein